MEQKMFCYQCQETAGCKGCTMSGVCGKKPDVAAMQDLLVYVTKGISAITTALRQEGKQVSAKINHLITLNLFTTITNANFDKESIESRIRATLTEKEVLLKQVTNLTVLPEAAKWNGAGNWEEKARTVGVLSTENEDIRSLRELITYGLKGLSAYSKHANVLLKDNDEVDTFLQKALAATLNDNLSVEDLIALTMETGKYGVSGMAMLDKANTDSYGNPKITKVNIGVRKNPGQRSHKEQYGDQGHINESCDSCRMKALFLLGRNFIQLGVSGALVFSKTRLDHVYRAPSNNKGAEEGGCDHEEPVTGCVYGKGGFWHERLDGIIGKALEQCVGSCYHQVRGKTGLGACVANHHTHNGVLAHAHVYNGGHGRDHHHGSVGSDVADGSDECYHIGNQGSRNVL